MTDDELKGRLEADLPTVDAHDIETALMRTRATAHTRQRRRRTALWLAPVFAAAATVAVVLLVTLGPGPRHHAAPSSPGPAPSPSAVPAWFRHAVGRSTAASGSVDLTSVWVVRLSDANHGTFDVRPSTRFGTGTLRYDGSRGGWVVDVLNRNCGGHDGVYRVALDGPSLTFTVVADPCELRRELLDNAVFAPLTNPDQLVG